MESIGFDEFVQAARATCAANLEPIEAARQLGPAFASLLRNERFLEERFGLPREGEYGETLLYHDPDYGFVILSRTQRPRRLATPPHDHGPLWALYGVYRNRMLLRRYAVDPRASGEFPGLALIEEREGPAGLWDAIPPHTLHQPANPSDDPSVILVVYNQPLATVTRRVWRDDLQRLVEFQGDLPASAPPS